MLLLLFCMSYISHLPWALSFYAEAHMKLVMRYQLITSSNISRWSLLCSISHYLHWAVSVDCYGDGTINDWTKDQIEDSTLFFTWTFCWCTRRKLIFYRQFSLCWNIYWLGLTFLGYRDRLQKCICWLWRFSIPHTSTELKYDQSLLTMSSICRFFYQQ